MVKVSVKWQKELFSDLEIDTEQPPLVFKGQLFALTGVPPERQKIMVKGGMLQDFGEWSKYSIKEGQRLMMMGTAEAAPVAPPKAAVFIEDLPEEDQDGASVKDYTAGLVNLGNTCYMNATVQCLRSVPELRTALSSYSPSDGIPSDSSHSLTVAARDLFSQLGSSLRPVTPLSFLQNLRQKFPQFAQRGEGGMYMQQDAEECWTQLVFALSQRLRSTSTPSAAVVKDLFGIEMSSRISCAESGEEASESETTFAMKCHISSEVNEIKQGLTLGLKSELEKNSAALGRSALFVKEAKISRLPEYLTVQFVRFFWKRESQQKAKILRTVAYPLSLDVYDFCTPELQEKLNKPRTALRLKEAEAAFAPRGSEKNPNGSGSGSSQQENKEDNATEGGSGAASSSSSQSSKAAVEDKNAATAVVKDGAGGLEGRKDAVGDAMDVQVDGEGGEKGKGAGVGGDHGVEGANGEATGMDVEGQASLPAPPAAPVPLERTTATGVYDLIAVLTHMGRSADSGHYVAWVKQESGQWIEFDDEKTIYRREEEITKLAGGGDWHMAYMLLYKARTFSS